MFVKREDGLGPVFLPFTLPALALAAVCALWGGASGWWRLLVFAGCWAGLSLGLLLLFYFLIWLYSLTIDVRGPTPTEDHPRVRFIVVTVIGQLCRYARVRARAEGLEKLPEGRFLIVSNHRSSYDPIVTVWMLRKTPTAFITKPENHRIPIAGPMIFRANYLPIDRSDPREAMKTIQAAAELLKNDVVSVGVYPEGTRNPTPESGLLPFHNGVLKIAQKARAPLVVATIEGTEHIRKNFPWRYTEVLLSIRQVIPPEELGGTTAALSERVQEIIGSALNPPAAG